MGRKISTSNANPTHDHASLPPDVREEDLKYGKSLHGNTDKQWEEYHDFCAAMTDAGVPSRQLTFYRVKGLGWVLCTLHISNPGRRTSAVAQTARSYGIGVVDGKVYRVGKGPHVEREVTVYLTQENWVRLAKYITLHGNGMAAAGQIRDRISSRRAQGQLYRAEGRTSWTW